MVGEIQKLMLRFWVYTMIFFISCGKEFSVEFSERLIHYDLISSPVKTEFDKLSANQNTTSAKKRFDLLRRASLVETEPVFRKTYEQRFSSPYVFGFANNSHPVPGIHPIIVSIDSAGFEKQRQNITRMIYILEKEKLLNSETVNLVKKKSGEQLIIDKIDLFDCIYKTLEK
jgi:hypothetical protein